MSVRPLAEADRAVLYALLAAQPEANTYMLGNLETLGFDAPFCTFWGDFDENAAPSLRGVANRYFSGWSVYGRAEADWPALAALVDADATAERLQDNPGGVASLVPFLRQQEATRIDDEELMRLDAAAFAPRAAPDGWQIRRAGIDDLDALSALYDNAEDMQRSRASTERPLRDGRVFIAEHTTESHGDIAAAALTNAETRAPHRLAMIGGVYTLPSERGRGLSSAVCSALCTDLLRAELTPALYWQNPTAGRIYHALGFHAVGRWRSVWLRRR